MKLMAAQSKLQKRKWAEQMLRKDSSATEKQVLSCNHQGQHRRGRLRRSWRRMTYKDASTVGRLGERSRQYLATKSAGIASWRS